MTVQVYNAASAPESQIRKGLVGAGWILLQAAIETHWVECGIRRAIGRLYPGVYRALEPGLFVLSILAGDPRGGESGDALGFAVLAGQGNGAAVIYPRIVSKIRTIRSTRTATSWQVSFRMNWGISCCARRNMAKGS